MVVEEREEQERVEERVRWESEGNERYRGNEVATPPGKLCACTLGVLVHQEASTLLRPVHNTTLNPASRRSNQRSVAASYYEHTTLIMVLTLTERRSKRLGFYSSVAAS